LLLNDIKEKVYILIQIAQAIQFPGFPPLSYLMKLTEGQNRKAERSKGHPSYFYYCRTRINAPSC